MQNVTMLPEVTKLMKNESCAVAMMSLAHDGHFTMNEIAVYYNLLAFSYFGANLRFLTAIEKNEARFSELIGSNQNDYKRLRTKFRKLGLMTCSVGKYEWIGRNPARLLPVQQMEEPAKKYVNARVITSDEGTRQVQLELIAAWSSFMP